MLLTLCRLAFPCMLTSSQAIAYPNQTDLEYLCRMVKKGLFGDIHIRTGMSLKSTQTIDSTVKSTEVQALKVQFTRSLAYGTCVWMWLYSETCLYRPLYVTTFVMYRHDCSVPSNSLFNFIVLTSL